MIRTLREAQQSPLTMPVTGPQGGQVIPGELLASYENQDLIRHYVTVRYFKGARSNTIHYEIAN